MGKRKTKTQKQKQKQANRTSHRLARAFAKKLGVASSSGDVDANDMKLDVVVNPNSAAVSPAQKKQKQKKQMSSSRKLLAKLLKEKQQKLSAAEDGKNQKQDFLQQHDSLRQRELQIEWKRNLARGGARRRQKQQQKQQEPMISLAAASFAATDREKSIAQLVGETTLKVSAFALGQGQAAPPLFPTPSKQQQPSPTPFSTPKSSTAWGEEATEEQPMASNPWAVLADDEDEESMDGKQKAKPSAATPASPTFVFAPATFSLQNPATTTSPAQGPMLDVDPDL